MPKLQNDKENPLVLAFRWGKLLKQMLPESNYTKLANEINEGVDHLLPPRNPGAQWSDYRVKDDIIDVRTIKNLIHKPDLSKLNVEQLAALDFFFSVKTGNPAMFERDLLGVFPLSGHVRFVLGSAADDREHVNVVRAWDSKAMAALLGELARIRPNTQSHIEDFPTLRASLSSTTARMEYLLKSGESMVSIGSSIANPASEILMAEICGVEPFRRTGAEPPFQFVWADSAHMQFPSAFASAAIQKHRGILIGPFKAYLNQEAPTYGYHHALVLFFRRATGRISMVLAGTTGPATCGTAQAIAAKVLIHQTVASLDDRSILWVVIRVRVNKPKIGPGDSRTVDLRNQWKVVDSGIWEHKYH